MESWCSSLVEEKVFFQLLWLEGGAYLWIGSGDHRIDSLAVGVPASAGARGRAATPSATTLLGGHEGDAGSQRLAQRLSSKVGRPIFVSLNLRDDPQLRLFAEREAVAALTARVAASSTTSASGAAGLERLSSLALDAAPSQAVPAAPAAPAPASAPVSTFSEPSRNLLGTVSEPSLQAPAPVSSSPAAGVAGGAGDGTARGTRTREVFASPDGLASRAVALLLEAAAAAIAERGVFVVAVSGGSIPALLAPELLAAAPRDQLSRWRLFLADERHVAESHPDSSLGEWRRRFLEPAGMGSVQAVGVAAALPLPQAAELYEEKLLAALREAAAAAGGGAAAAASQAESAPPLRLDAVLLGMGPDGHTASLFPAHAVLCETGRAVTYVEDSPKPPACRVTLTLPAINAARLALFVVTGGSKATAVRAAFAAQPDEPVPAGLVLAAGRTHWCLDEPAAAQLREAEAAAERLYG